LVLANPLTVPLDPQAKDYLDRLAALGVPPTYELPLDEARRAGEAAAGGLFGPVDDVTCVEDRTAAGAVAVRVYEPAPAVGTLVYFHGGGWVAASLDTHDGVCRALAVRAGCRVVSVDYRLAPEHRFPAALEDAWDATVWATELDDGPVAVGGDSAGGNLAAVVALRARDHGLPLALQILVYPVLDRDFDRPSYLSFATGYGLTRDAMSWYWDQYLGPSGNGSAPEASPLRAAALTGVAPALVITAEFDPLRDEGEEYAARLDKAGVPVTLSRYDGQIHGFFRMPAVIARAEDALDETAAALRAALRGEACLAPT
jgi:acetyl esterase/lipase